MIELTIFYLPGYKIFLQNSFLIYLLKSIVSPFYFLPTALIEDIDVLNIHVEPEASDHVNRDFEDMDRDNDEQVISPSDSPMITRRPIAPPERAQVEIPDNFKAVVNVKVALRKPGCSARSKYVKPTIIGFNSFEVYQHDFHLHPHFRNELMMQTNRIIKNHFLLSSMTQHKINFNLTGLEIWASSFGCQDAMDGIQIHADPSMVPKYQPVPQHFPVHPSIYTYTVGFEFQILNLQPGSSTSSTASATPLQPILDSHTVNLISIGRKFVAACDQEDCFAIMNKTISMIRDVKRAKEMLNTKLTNSSSSSSSSSESEEEDKNQAKTSSNSPPRRRKISAPSSPASRSQTSPSRNKAPLFTPAFRAQKEDSKRKRDDRDARKTSRQNETTDLREKRLNRERRDERRVKKSNDDDFDDERASQPYDRPANYNYNNYNNNYRGRAAFRGTFFRR